MILFDGGDHTNKVSLYLFVLLEHPLEERLLALDEFFIVLLHDVIDNILSRKIAHVRLRMPQSRKLPNNMLEGILNPGSVEFLGHPNSMQFEEFLYNPIYLNTSNCLFIRFAKLAAHLLSSSLQASKVVEADAWDREFFGAVNVLDE